MNERQQNTKEQNRIECVCVYVLGERNNQNRNGIFFCCICVCMRLLSQCFYDERMNKTRESTIRVKIKTNCYKLGYTKQVDDGCHHYNCSAWYKIRFDLHFFLNRLNKKKSKAFLVCHWNSTERAIQKFNRRVKHFFGRCKRKKRCEMKLDAHLKKKKKKQ